MFRRNPKRLMRKMASEVGISKSSMHRLIHEDLKMKSLVLQKHQFLNDLHKKKRLKRCKILHDEIESGKSGEIVWSDKKLFTIEQSINRKKMTAPLQKIQKWSILMLKLFFDSRNQHQ